MGKSQLLAGVKDPLELESSLKIIAGLLSSEELAPKDVRKVLSAVLKASEAELRGLWLDEKKYLVLFKKTMPKNMSATSAQYFAHVANSYKTHANNITKLLSKQALTVDKLAKAVPSKTLAKLSVKDVISDADMEAIAAELMSLAGILEEEGLKFEGNEKIRECLKLIEASDRMSEKELTSHIHSLLDELVENAKKLKEPFKSAFSPLVSASKTFVSQSVAQGEVAALNLPSFIRLVRNVVSILITSYFANRLLWIYVKTQSMAGNKGPGKFFGGVLHMFPPTYRPTAFDTPTLLWGYFLTVIFVTIFYLAVRWYILKSREQK